MNKSFQIPYTQKRPISGTSSTCMQICILQNWCVQTLMLNRPTGYIFACNYTQNRPISGTSVCIQLHPKETYIWHIYLRTTTPKRDLYLAHLCAYNYTQKRPISGTSICMQLHPKETYIWHIYLPTYILYANMYTSKFICVCVCVCACVCVCVKKDPYKHKRDLQTPKRDLYTPKTGLCAHKKKKWDICSICNNVGMYIYIYICGSVCVRVSKEN